MKAGPSTESHLVKKPSKRAKPKDPRDRTATGATAMSVKSTLEDELLGLVEGEEDHPGGGGGSRPRASSPPPYSDDELDDDDHDTLDVERFDPDMIVQPSGLTRAEIIAKVQRGHMAGLTELDVKAVQDEMWLREKAAAPMNKDGTVRRKPGPAKGWKKLRGGIDWDERSEGTSIGEGTVGERERERGDADAEIAALLGEDDEEGDETFTPGGAKKAKAKSLLKKRKLDLGSEGGLAEGSGLGSEFDSEDDRSRTKSGPGVGTGGRKGKSKAITTATGPEHDLEAELEMAAIAMDPQQAKAEAQAQVEPVVHIPNTQDPRGVSEAEARHRLHMVEDLEKLVWASICRDIPRVRFFLSTENV
jgi:DNA helicase INO80